MANDLQHFSSELWSARVQNLLKNNLVSGAIANTEERSTLIYGDRIRRPYHSELYAQDYTKGTAATILDVSTTDEYLDVDQAKILPIYVDDIDDIQNKYKTMDKLSMRAAYELRDLVDRACLAEVANAGLYNSTAWTLATNNIVQALSEAKAALVNNGCESNAPWYAVLDPDTVSIIEQYFSANGFRKQDETLVNGYGLGGYMGDFLGLKCFQSQNVKSTATLVYSDDPTNATTLIINGVTFTFVSSLGTTAGNVLIDAGSDVDVTLGTNLVAAINGTTAGSIYYPLAAADRAKLKRRGVTATYAASTNTLTITAAGKMTIGGTQDTCTSSTQVLDLPMGQMGNFDLVMQKDVKSEFARTTGDTSPKLGTNILTWALYGKKTFVEGAQRMYRLRKTA